MSTTYPILAIPPAAVAPVRATRRDGWGNDDLTPTRVTEAHSTPCRVCLRDAEPGDEVLLFSYSPFAGPTPYRTVGPVFAHATECPPYAHDGAIPEQLARRLLSVRAMTADARIRVSDVCEGRELAAMIDRLFADPAVAELHVHTARNGCYLCKVVRS